MPKELQSCHVPPNQLSRRDQRLQSQHLFPVAIASLQARLPRRSASFARAAGQQ